MVPFQQVLAAAFVAFAVPAAAKATATTDVELDTLRSNTGALTTVFTPDPTCLSEIEARAYRPGAYPELAVGCEGLSGNQCCPPRWGLWRYFSPGVCPEGYQACALPSTSQREETTRMCCPENFDCPSKADYYAICKSSLNTETTVYYTDVDGNSSVATFRAVTASPIQIRFKATDSDVVPIPTDSFDLPPPPTKEELEEEERQRQAAQGLSTGAKAGIAVGATVGVAGLALGAWWFFKLRKSKERRTNTAMPFMVLQDQATEELVDGPGEAPPPYSKK